MQQITINKHNAKSIAQSYKLNLEYGFVSDIENDNINVNVNLLILGLKLKTNGLNVTLSLGKNQVYITNNDIFCSSNNANIDVSIFGKNQYKALTQNQALKTILKHIKKK